MGGTSPVHPLQNVPYSSQPSWHICARAAPGYRRLFLCFCTPASLLKRELRQRLIISDENILHECVLQVTRLPWWRASYVSSDKPSARQTSRFRSTPKFRRSHTQQDRIASNSQQPHSYRQLLHYHTRLAMRQTGCPSIRHRGRLRELLRKPT
jgi:hypothetical protein